MGSKLLVILTMFLGTSCQTGISFDPDFYVPRVDEESNAYLVNEDGLVVFYYEPEFELFGCLTEEKIQELRKILSEARLPRQEKVRLLKALDLPATF